VPGHRGLETAALETEARSRAGARQDLADGIVEKDRLKILDGVVVPDHHEVARAEKDGVGQSIGVGDSFGDGDHLAVRPSGRPSAASRWARRRARRRHRVFIEIIIP